MLNELIRNIIWIVGLVLLQALLLCDIHLFDVITPMLYVYFILIPSRSFPRWLTLLLSFFMGLFIDMFCNTPGVSAFSLTLVSFVQPYYLEAFLDKDTPANFQPALSSMPNWSYITYSFPLVLLFFILQFSLEAFTLENVAMWAEGMFGSFVLTYLFVLALERLRSSM